MRKGKELNYFVGFVGICWIFFGSVGVLSFLPDGQAPETNSSSLAGGGNCSQLVTASLGRDKSWERSL